jgi:hypothetical protein
LEQLQDGIASQIIEGSLLTDDLESMGDQLPASSDTHPIVVAIKNFLQGRHNIETSWDYEKTYQLYETAINGLRDANPTNESEEALVRWLKGIVTGHLKLQQAEADWTFCNFRRSAEEYYASSQSFSDSCNTLDGVEALLRRDRLVLYSRAWESTALGLHYNMQGFLKLREMDIESATRLFVVAKDHLNSAEKGFLTLNNTLGFQDARSYMVDERIWGRQKLAFAKAFSVTWKDFAFFEQDGAFDKILSLPIAVHMKYPSNILISKDVIEDFKFRTVLLGGLDLSEVGDLKPPSISIRMNFHPNRLVEIQYTLEMVSPVDIFFLYLLKILNTEAVPKYSVEVKGEMIGEFQLGNIRFHDLTRHILKVLCQRVGEKQEPLLTSSASFVVVHDFSRKIEPRYVGKEGYEYLSILFSSLESFSWEKIANPKADSDTNLIQGVEPTTIAYASQNSVVLVVPDIQEWKVQVYFESLEYLLVLRECIEKLSALIERQGNLISLKLDSLRNSISKSQSLSRKFIRELMIENLRVREYMVQILEIRRRFELLVNNGIEEAKLFTSNASSRIKITEKYQNASTLVEKIETLYTTVYNLGQEYLSLEIAINSDISRQAFNILNVVMMGSLGLAVVTAVVGTPISYTFAGLGVFATSFVGYLYLRYVKSRTDRSPS